MLTEDRLGAFVKEGDGWRREWIPVKDLAGSVIIEGVGTSLLRLTREGNAVRAGFRFSLRHAKEIARLQRRLQNRIEGKSIGEEIEPRAEHWDQKKARCDKCGRVIPTWSETCPVCLSRRKVLSRLMDFVKPYRVRAVSGLLLAFLATSAGLVRPYLTRPMLDVGLGVGPGRHADYSVLLGYVVLLAVLTLLSVIADSIRERIMASLGSRISRDIRERTYAHLHKLSLSFFSKKPRIATGSGTLWRSRASS